MEQMLLEEAEKDFMDREGYAEHCFEMKAMGEKAQSFEDWKAHCARVSAYFDKIGKG